MYVRTMCEQSIHVVIIERFRAAYNFKAHNSANGVIFLNHKFFILNKKK